MPRFSFNSTFVACREKNFVKTRSIRTFRDEHDWIQELERCGVSYQTGAWRILSMEHPSSENGLPRHFVVPKHLTDSQYFDLCNSFRCKRAAIWVWGIGNASLVRMADLLPDLLNNPKELTPSKDSLMLEHIRICAKCPPRLLELTNRLPSIQDVYQSYIKLRALCTPVSDRELMVQDERFLTLLEKTCWLLYVSLCIKTANEAATSLRAGESVALQENDGRDMCALVSSLVQVLLDPFYRTITGFQVLIQKEWVALGHPFSDRIGHVYTKQADKSPIFLLFLDCVWQTLQQFPESFEFSETFLTTIWDAVFLPVFDTFQFNCEYDRSVAERDEQLTSRPVWDWGQTFTDKDIMLFSNPLYRRPTMSDADIENHRRSKLPPSALKLPGMDVLPIKSPRFSLHSNANKMIDLDAKLLLPSQILNQQPEAPKIEKSISNEANQVRIRALDVLPWLINFIFSGETPRAEPFDPRPGRLRTVLLPMDAHRGHPQRRLRPDLHVQSNDFEQHSQAAERLRDRQGRRHPTRSEGGRRRRAEPSSRAELFLSILRRRGRQQ